MAATSGTSGSPSTGRPGSGLSHAVAIEPALFILTTAVRRR
jgi:hypothetical protein